MVLPHAALANGRSSSWPRSSPRSSACRSPAPHMPPMTPAQTLAPVVVTATRAPQPLADAIPQTIAVRCSRTSPTPTPTDALGLLALAPGVQITRNGGPGATSGLLLARRVVDAVARADRRRARRVGETRRGAALATDARSDRPRRSGERQRVGAVRLGCDRRRRADLHEGGRRSSAALQLRGRVRQLSHAAQQAA